MDAKTLAQLITEFNRVKALTGAPLRYTGTMDFRRAASEYTGFGKPGQSMAEIREHTIQNLKAIDILSDVLSGEKLSEADAAYLGVDLEELRRALQKPWKKRPEKPLVVLTFDDAFRDDILYAAPLLEKYRFNATFFVTEVGPSAQNRGFSDKTLYMRWEEIRELSDRGFEIGNHSTHHRFRPNEPFDSAAFRAEVLDIHERFDRYGIPLPGAFAYPGGRCTEEMVSELIRCGYVWGRGNLMSGVYACTANSIYLPSVDNRFATPAYGDTSLFSPEKLEKLVRRAGTEGIVILAYHQIHDDSRSHPANMSLDEFTAQMEKLCALDCIVTSYAGLSEYLEF